MYTPLNYNKLNIVESSYIPSMVKSRNNRVYDYWCRALYLRAISPIIINVPPKWQGNVKDFLYYCLYRYGFVAVFSRPDLGTVFNPCNLYGIDFFYQPTNAIITNPKFTESLDLKIGTECEIIKINPDFLGVFDIIGYYAEKLATLDNAINISIINNKFSYILAGKTKAVTEALKKMMDKINRGEPAVFLDKTLVDDPQSKDTPFQFMERKNLKESYLTSDQLADMQTLLNAFDAEIGIPTVPYHKKERMNVAETESRNIDAVSRSLISFDTLKDSINIVNAMFPELKLSVEMRYPVLEESEVSDNE